MPALRIIAGFVRKMGHLPDTPAQAVQSCSLPIEIPMPLAPTSPRPRMRPPVETQMKRRSLVGQLRRISAVCPLRWIETYMPRARR